MVQAKCSKCGASATDKTFEDARKKLDHAVGLSRGIKCGDNYGKVFEVKDKLKPQLKPIKIEIPKEEEPTIESSEPQPETLQKKEKKNKKSKVTKEKYL